MKQHPISSDARYTVAKSPNFMTTIEPKTLAQLDDFKRGYIMAAFWTNDDDAPGGCDYSQSGRPEIMFAKLAPEAGEQLCMEADAFQNLFGFNWRASGQFAAKPHAEYLDDEAAGHNFWLTRNHHGTGFWDRDELPEAEQDALTKAAHECGTRDLYLGDDGKLYTASAGHAQDRRFTPPLTRGSD